jgi:TFIIF-interacting CTD phosphatase-like protein
VYYLIRPGAIRFINELSKYYEIVIFTAAMPDVRLYYNPIQYADWIMDNVDRYGVVKHRLYRQHTTPHEDYAMYYFGTNPCIERTSVCLADRLSAPSS